MDTKEQAYSMISDRILNLIKENFGAFFKAYYNGAPEQIPENAMPALIIQSVGGRTDLDATGTDLVIEESIINIIANSKDGFGASDDLDSVMRQLQILVQGIDPATGSFSDSSVLGVLRKNLTLDSTVIDNDVQWEYNRNPRIGNDSEEVSSICEAVINVTTRQRIIISNYIN
jgi:hypothetical protein